MPKRKAYPSDLTDAQWEILEPLIPGIAADATNVSYERREIVNGILYVLRSGCPWRLVPHDLPAWGTLYWYFRRWRNEGVWEEILQNLRGQLRHKQGRDAEPSAAVIDSQSIKTSAVRGPDKGYDAGKKNLGAQTARAGGYAGPSLGGQGDGSQRLRSAGSQELAGTAHVSVCASEIMLGR
jgi:transposase